MCHSPSHFISKRSPRDFGYAAVCTLGPNDAVKTFLSARVLRGPVAPKQVKLG